MGRSLIWTLIWQLTELCGRATAFQSDNLRMEHYLRGIGESFPTLPFSYPSDIPWSLGVLVDPLPGGECRSTTLTNTILTRRSLGNNVGGEFQEPVLAVCAPLDAPAAASPP